MLSKIGNFTIFMIYLAMNSSEAAQPLIIQTPLIAAGQYRDSHMTRRPLLALSQDAGASWSYPAAINAPTFTPQDINPFLNEGIIASTSCNSTLCILAGLYNDQHQVVRPLLSLSRDAGQTWIYPATINAPIFSPKNNYPFAHNGLFIGTSCSESTCIATGMYTDSYNKNRPLLALSQDSGTTWIYPDSITNPIFTPHNNNRFASDGILYSASCSEAICIATGVYTDKQYANRPLLAVSQDSGTTWTYPAAINSPQFIPGNPNPFIDEGGFNSGSCHGTTCIAAGEYTDNYMVSRPLLALSQDAGKTWIYPAIINNPVFSPEDINTFYNDGFFNSASCYNTRCMSAGFYRDNQGIIRPLLATSNDSGSTWLYPASVTAPVFTPDNINPFAHSGIFMSVECNQVNCIAAGYYIDEQNISRPILAINKNSEETWIFPASINNPIFTPDNRNSFAKNGIFNSISCNETSCIAIGHYADANQITRPLLAISQDSGTTWTYPSAINAPEFTPENSNPFAKNGSFNSGATGVKFKNPNITTI